MAAVQGRAGKVSERKAGPESQIGEGGNGLSSETEELEERPGMRTASRPVSHNLQSVSEEPAPC